MKFSTSVLTAIAIASVANGMVIPSVEGSQQAAASLSAPQKREAGEAPLYTAGTTVPHKYIVVLKNALNNDQLTTHKNWVKKQ